MADRTFYNTQAAQAGMKYVYGQAAIGASGAPTLSTTNSNGVTSISRTSAGLYLVTLDSKYYAYGPKNFELIASAAEDLIFQTTAESSSAGTYSFLCTTGGVATDPSSGSTLKFGIYCRNVSV